MIARLSLALALGLALLCAGLPDPLAGGVSVAGAQAAPAASQTEATDAPVAPSGSGLPQRAPDPRTLHEYWPFFVGFTVIWAGIVAYLLTVGGAFGRIARSVQQAAEERSAAGGGA